ncbi:ATP synthase F1 subunit delta [Apilactobacillus apinorum]|uniref:ATP synthase F1 subunit delta n=1 Tax=Apilactobacillus apinorum TaxID=1218495 RepID=UPI0006B40E28|nr:ATP synthase F1 subunit delta [Apilactobacillus apinorum]KOY69195.1 ATP synthase subunit delta [Apilactobacillus apinorum]CAI2646678.1 atpH ATP synthase subunit delta [Apilactobacillus apinorum]
MLDKITFAKRYSKALYEVLEEQNAVETGLKELLSIKQVFVDNPSLEQALTDVSFPEDKKESLIKPLIDNSDVDYVKNLLKVLLGSNKMDELTLIVEEFEQSYNEKNKIVHADAVSVVPLTDEQKDNLASAFKARVGANEVILDNKVDQSLIGGVILKSSNVIFDGSVKTKINNIKKLLLS